mmetsp:Transcript_117669/g.240614  ORF Transcript_117669/g.240614 Transcript_117669/m.240614 type:complete len:169 (+) Transcript_117669:378-884(+)
MVKKRSTTGCRRKKSNTTRTNKEQQQPQAGKRLKTVSDAKNRLAAAIKAMVDSMEEEHLYSLMEYAGKIGKELIASEKQAAANASAAAKARTTTTTTTTEIVGAKTTITMTTGGVSNSEPRTPLQRTQETKLEAPQEATPPPIQFNKTTRPPADNSKNCTSLLSFWSY